MFDRFKKAPVSEVKAHVENMMKAHALAGKILDETEFHSDDRVIKALRDFMSDDVFSVSKKHTKNIVFRASVKKFQQDLVRIIVQATEEYKFNISLKELNGSKSWLDEQLSFLTRSREQQIRLADELKSLLKPIEEIN